MDLDILVYIALFEEFNDAVPLVEKLLRRRLSPYELPHLAFTCFQASIAKNAATGPLSLVFLPAGGMGNTRSGSAVSAVASHFLPRNIVVMGLAGTISSDLQPGDV